MCVHLINISASFPQKINVDNAPSADSPQTPSIKDNFFSPADGGEQDPAPLLEAFYLPSSEASNIAHHCQEFGLDLKTLCNVAWHLALI